MQRVILCEGRTDAILISYLLEKCWEWHFNNKLTVKPRVRLPAERQNECLNWYSRHGVDLAIWAVGGYTEIPAKLKRITERTRHEQNETLRFSHIVIVCDRDWRTAEQSKAEINEWLADAGVELGEDLEPGRWLGGTIALERTPKAHHSVKILALVLPPSTPGGLETFLLKALAENHDNKVLVDKAHLFVDCVSSKTSYLKKSRLKPKAQLGSVLSVMSPDWVFSELNERLTRVKWEDLTQVSQVWGLLEHLSQ